MKHYLAMALACTAVLACGGGGAGPDPSPPPSLTHDIVFDSEAVDGSRGLHRTTLDGVVQQLTNGADAVRAQARPDGQAILFTSASIRPDAIPSLMLIDGPDQPAVAVSDQPGVVEREATYSPDGTRIAFVSQRDESGGADIFVATLSGRRLSEVRNLTPGGSNALLPPLDVTPAWSPNGRRIAFSSNRSGGDFTLWVMDADGSNPREVTPSGPYADVFPSWSPDGSTLAFQRRGTTVVRIGIVPAAGGALGFFEFEGRAFSPAWSPDGQSIAFTGEVNGEQDIHIRPASGLGPVTRIRHSGADRNPAWIRRLDGP